MATWHDLPTEVVVEVFRYLRTEELLPLAIVDREWRAVIGAYFSCSQFQCSWAEVWERISHPETISLYRFHEHGSYGLYDPRTQCVLIFHSSVGDSNCTISTYADSCLLPTSGQTMVSSDAGMLSTHRAPRGHLVRHWILASGHILLIDDLGYLYHLSQPAQAPLGTWELTQASQSFTDGKKIRSYAACLYHYREEEFLFLCGGNYQQNALSSRWKTYNCTQRTFAMEGELPDGKARVNHSACAYYDRDTGEPFVLVCGGKSSHLVFSQGSLLSDAVIVPVLSHSVGGPTPSGTSIAMRQCRNLHTSYYNSQGHIVVLGGTAMEKGEQFLTDQGAFEDTQERISLKWNAAIVPYGDSVIVERKQCRLLEEVNPLTGSVTMASQSLVLPLTEKGAEDSYRWCVTERQDELYALLHHSRRGFCLQRIPHRRLRIGIPRCEEIQRVRDKDTPRGLACGDGFLYALGEDFEVVDVFCFSSSFPNEIARTVRDWKLRSDCLSLQFHFLSSIDEALRALLWEDVADIWPGHLFIGLDLKDCSPSENQSVVYL